MKNTETGDDVMLASYPAVTGRMPRLDGLRVAFFDQSSEAIALARATTTVR